MNVGISWPWTRAVESRGFNLFAWGGGGGGAGVVIDGVKVVVPAEPREKPKKETYFVIRQHQHLSEDPLLIFATFRWGWLPTGISTLFYPSLHLFIYKTTLSFNHIYPDLWTFIALHGLSFGREAEGQRGSLAWWGWRVGMTKLVFMVI